MRVALCPLRWTPGDFKTSLGAIAACVEKTHAEADLLVFPEIDLARWETPASVPKAMRNQALSDALSECLCRFAASRSTPVAMAMIDRMGSQRLRILVQADRSGQLNSQKCLMPPPEEEEEDEGLAFLTARIAGATAGFAVANPAGGLKLIARAKAAGLDALCLPLAFAGEPSEAGRIAAHNPPAALEGVVEGMAELAVQIGAPVFAVNGLTPDANGLCGCCGGAWHFDRFGRLRGERKLTVEDPLVGDAEPL